MNATSVPRQYPRLPPAQQSLSRPISFIVVRFSNELESNFMRSSDIRGGPNQIIVVDNTANLFFDNLVEAIQHGLSQARHELVAVVHEDVLLPDYWQAYFEESLSRLEEHDINWGMIGPAGWTKEKTVVGHWSDPQGYNQLFVKPHGFTEVHKLDEPILVFHRARMPKLDLHIPGIHHLGHHLAMQLRRKSLKTYAIDAPIIHKYADVAGRLIQTNADSVKIMDRGSLTYKADRACCNEYMKHCWPEAEVDDYREPDLRWKLTPDKERQLDEPIIFISRGGSGSRLLSDLALDAGVFLGDNLNISGDPLDLAMPIYQGVVEKYRCKSAWQKQQTIPRLKAASARMIANIPPGRSWGFKLPESLLLLPEICDAYPRARFVHLLRDPLTTCLRRTHLTARLDNHIGRIAIPLAYDTLGLSRKSILMHSPAHHMAYTTIHQLGEAKSLRKQVGVDSFFECRFEDLLASPDQETKRLCNWLGLPRAGSRLNESIDPGRARRPKVSYPESVTREISMILAPLREELGYA